MLPHHLIEIKLKDRIPGILPSQPIRVEYCCATHLSGEYDCRSEGY